MKSCTTANKMTPTLDVSREWFGRCDSVTMPNFQPHLEYSQLFCVPMAASGLQKAEQIQRCFTRNIPGMSDLSYWERLQQLRLNETIISSLGTGKKCTKTSKSATKNVWKMNQSVTESAKRSEILPINDDFNFFECLFLSCISKMFK